MSSTSTFRYWIPVVVYAVLIIVLALRPAGDLPRWPINDKLIHFAEYALFGCLLFRLLHRNLKATLRLALGMTALGVALFALLDETLQRFAPGRTPDIRDWVVDILGAGCGIAIYLLVRHILDYRAKQRQEGLA